MWIEVPVTSIVCASTVTVGFGGFLYPLCQLLARRVKGGDCVTWESVGLTRSSRIQIELAKPPSHILWEVQGPPQDFCKLHGSNIPMVTSCFNFLSCWPLDLIHSSPPLTASFSLPYVNPNLATSFTWFHQKPLMYRKILLEIKE